MYTDPDLYGWIIDDLDRQAAWLDQNDNISQDEGEKSFEMYLQASPKPLDTETDIEELSVEEMLSETRDLVESTSRSFNEFLQNATIPSLERVNLNVTAPPSYSSRRRRSE